MVSWLALALLVSLLAWGYWDALTVLPVYWQSPPYWMQWTIPMLALIVLWARRRSLRPVAAGARWAGVLLLSVALAVRLLASSSGWLLVELATFVPALASLWLVVWGWRGLAAAGPATALLLFMRPRGWEQENTLLNRMQGAATRSSVFALQTLTGEAYREGNVIYVGESPHGIVGPSSRIRLAPVVVALAAAVALAVRRPLWECLVIFLSGPALVVVVNGFRLTLAGLLHSWGVAGATHWVLRDPGAGLMLVTAGLLVLAEYMGLSHLFREVPAADAATPETETTP